MTTSIPKKLIRAIGLAFRAAADDENLAVRPGANTAAVLLPVFETIRNNFDIVPGASEMMQQLREQLANPILPVHLRRDLLRGIAAAFIDAANKADTTVN